MELVDLLGQDAFSRASMTEAINQVEFAPTQLTGDDLFKTERIRTDTAQVDIEKGKLTLIAHSERGDPIKSQSTKGPRRTEYFKTGRRATHGSLTASELAFTRQTGSDQLLEVKTEIAKVWDRKYEDMKATFEHMALGCTDGLVIDTDGTILYDYYDKFGVSRPSTINFDFKNLKEGDCRNYIMKNIVRPMRRNAKGAQYSYVRALCGEDAFDGLQANPEFYKTFETQQAGAELRGSTEDIKTNFAGVLWEEYVGTDDTSTIALAPDEIRFIPAGKGNSVFRKILSPGEKFSDIGKEGEDLYSWLKLDDPDDPSMIDVFLAAYRLYMCARPEMIRRGRVI